MQITDLKEVNKELRQSMEELKELYENPRQKAVIVSGFTHTERIKKTLDMGAGSFVRKPYVLEKIGSAVRKVLDSRQ